MIALSRDVEENPGPFTLINNYKNAPCAKEVNSVSLLESRLSGKGKVCIRANVAHQAGAYPGFCSMKRLGAFLLPPGWDASPSQGYPQH